MMDLDSLSIWQHDNRSGAELRNEPQQTTAAATTAGNVPYGWILHPVIDLLFCCGGLLWILAGVHSVFHWDQLSANDGAGLLSGSLITLFGTLALSDTHNAATLVRIYGSPGIGKTQPLLGPWGLAAFLVLAAASMFLHPILVLMAKIYLILIAQHVTAQAYGITLIYCAKRKYTMTAIERTLLKFVLQSAMFVAIVRQFVHSNSDKSNFLGLQMPVWDPLPTWVNSLAVSVLIVTSVLFASMVARKGIVEKQLIPFPALMLMTTCVVIFSFGRDVLGPLLLYMPAFFHASQYLVVTTSYHLKEQGLPDDFKPSKIASLLLTHKNLEYWGILLFLGIAIYGIIPCLFTKCSIPYATAFAAIFCAVNLHHFLADNAIWRMKDPKVRQLLTL